MASAEERAKAAGTSTDIIDKVKSQEFLLQCLRKGVRKSKFDQDLLQDIADACEINDLDALMLGSALLTVSEASEKLFLMPNEASAILEICRTECLRAGVNYGDGAVLDPADMEEEEDVPEPPAAKPAAVCAAPAAFALDATSASVSVRSVTQAVSPAPAMATPPAASAVSTSAAALPTPASTSIAAERVTDEPATSKLSAATSSSHVEPTFLIKPPTLSKLPVSASKPASNTTPLTARPAPATPATPAVAPTPRDRPPRPKPTPSSVATPRVTRPASATPNGTTPAPSTAAKGTGTSDLKSTAKTPRPSSAPLRTPGGPHGSSSSPADSVDSRTRPQSATPRGPLPSYAKPTASHQARTSGAEDAGSSPSTSAAGTPSAAAGTPGGTLAPSAGSSSKPPLTARVGGTLRASMQYNPRGINGSEEKREPKKPVFDNIRSSLLRPTKAFLAWAAGRSKDSQYQQHPQDSSDLRTPVRLAASTPKPFHLSESNKSKPLPKTSEELALEAAQSKTFKARPMPKGSTPSTSRTAGTYASSSPVAASGGTRAAGMPNGTSNHVAGVVGAATTPEPFKFAGAERHQRAQEELARKVEEKQRAELAVPMFKATPLPGSAHAAQAVPATPAAPEAEPEPVS